MTDLELYNFLREAWDRSTPADNAFVRALERILADSRGFSRFFQKLFVEILDREQLGELLGNLAAAAAELSRHCNDVSSHKTVSSLFYVFAHVKAQSRNPACILLCDKWPAALPRPPFFAAVSPCRRHNDTA